MLLTGEPSENPAHSPLPRFKKLSPPVHPEPEKMWATNLLVNDVHEILFLLTGAAATVVHEAHAIKVDTEIYESSVPCKIQETIHLPTQPLLATRSAPKKWFPSPVQEVPVKPSIW